MRGPVFFFTRISPVYPAYRAKMNILITAGEKYREKFIFVSISYTMNTRKIIEGGLAYILIALLLFFWLDKTWLLYIATSILVLIMIVPRVFQPLSWFWYTLTGYLGKLVSRVLLSVIFLVLVTPMGLLRKVMGKDNLKLKDFKKTGGSSFFSINKEFSAQDMDKPF